MVYDNVLKMGKQTKLKGLSNERLVEQAKMYCFTNLDHLLDKERFTQVYVELLQRLTFKNKILKYLKIRNESIENMLKEGFKKTGEIDDKVLEVMLTYSAIIRDIKNDRLD